MDSVDISKAWKGGKVERCEKVERRVFDDTERE